MTYSDLLVEYKDKTKDDTTANVARGGRRINAHHRILAADENYFWRDKALSITTVASQQVYDLPIDLDKVNSGIRCVDTGGDTLGVTVEITSYSEFDTLNIMGTDTTSDYIQFHHIRNKQLYIFPTPATAGYTLQGEYTRKPYKMTLEDVTTGTVSVTNGSTAVTGSSTQFDTENIKAGCVIEFDGDGIFYEVASVTNDTALVLSQDYEGVTASGLTYRAGHAPIIPEPYQDLLWLYPAFEYNMKKGDVKANSDITGMIKLLEDGLKKYSQSKSGSNIIKSRHRRIRNPNLYPSNITS